MGFNIPPQKQYFYKKPWNLKIDEQFLHIMNNEIDAVAKRSGNIPVEALLKARDELNNTYNLTLDWDEVYCRYYLLKDRYETFTLILKDQDTFWDRQANWILTSDEAWSRLFMRKSFARAYYSGDEPLYNQLACLFGLHDVKEEGSAAVVYVDLCSDSEVSCEVTSPPITSRRRRLFDNSTQSTAVPPPNAFPRRPRIPSPSHGGSSCSSSSPLMWWKP